jgi:hypothetical protein
MARGGQYLNLRTVTFGDGKSESGPALSCALGPPSAPPGATPFLNRLNHTWRQPGTYQVVVTLMAMCVTDVPLRTVRFRLVVQ